MIKPKAGFVKAELNTEKLTPLQWKGIMNAMENYAEHYQAEQLILSGVSKRFTENKMDDAYDKGYNDGYATGSTIM
jgi:hypothetical protein